MKISILWTLLLVAMLANGCALFHHRAKTAKTSPSAGETTPAIITPDNSLTARVVSYNTSGRFVVLSFPVGQMPKMDQSLFLYRDGMKVGDRVFFYHSMADPQAIAGICEVVREGYPDFTATDGTHPHFDPGSNPDAPTWFMVDVRAVAQFTRPVTLPEIKARKELANMALLRIGRLSVTPVRPAEWETIVEMAR